MARADTAHSEPVAVPGPEHHDDHGHDDHGHHAHEAHDPHESPSSMTGPLIVLALFAVLAGLVNAAPFGFHWLSHFLSQEPGEFDLRVVRYAVAARPRRRPHLALGISDYGDRFEVERDTEEADLVVEFSMCRQLGRSDLIGPERYDDRQHDEPDGRQRRLHGPAH